MNPISDFPKWMRVFGRTTSAPAIGAVKHLGEGYRTRMLASGFDPENLFHQVGYIGKGVYNRALAPAGRGLGRLAAGTAEMAYNRPFDTIVGGAMTVPLLGGAGLASQFQDANQQLASSRATAGGLIKTMSHNNLPFDAAALSRARALHADIEKLAGAGDKVKAFAGAMGRGAAMALGGSLALGGLAAARSGMHNLRRNRRYEAMLDSDEDLKRFAKRNPKQVRSAFNMVHRASPYIASEPMVAATVVRQVTADYAGAADEQKLDNLLRVEKNYQDTRVPYGASNIAKAMPTVKDTVYSPGTN